MNMNKKVKFIVVLTLLITTMSFMTGCKSKTPAKGDDTTVQTGQNDTSDSEDKQQEDSDGPKEVSLDDWKYDVPEGYVLEENSGPWYEKRYANENGVVLLFGYYAPNGIDNRTEKQLFEDQRDIEKQDMISRYGSGEITFEDVNNDNMIMTTYYETRDLKVLKRSKIEGQVWKMLYIEVPISENEEDYEYILDIIK